jgi:hypothetical protein
MLENISIMFRKTGSYEYGDEASVSIKFGEFLE